MEPGRIADIALDLPPSAWFDARGYIPKSVGEKLIGRWPIDDSWGFALIHYDLYKAKFMIGEKVIQSLPLEFAVWKPDGEADDRSSLT